MSKTNDDVLRTRLEAESKRLFKDHRILPLLERLMDSHRPARFEDDILEISRKVYDFIKTHNFSEIRCRKMRVERYEKCSSLEAMITLSDEIYEAIYDRSSFITRIFEEEDERMRIYEKYRDVEEDAGDEEGGAPPPYGLTP